MRIDERFGVNLLAAVFVSGIVPGVAGWCSWKRPIPPRCSSDDVTKETTR